MWVINTDINHVTQGENECGLACIAMVANVTLQEVKEEALDKMLWTEGDGLETESMISLLGHFDLKINRQINSTIRQGRVYIICVPSINRKFHNHSIVLDTRYPVHKNPNLINMCVHDPNEGFEGKDFYESSDLISWSSVIEIENWRVNNE